MKKGIVSSTVRACLPEGHAFGELFELAKKSGFDGVELQHGDPPREFHDGDPDSKMEEVRKAAEAAGVEIPSVMPTSQDLGSPDAQKRAEGVKVLERVCEEAALLGAKVVLIVPGRVRPDCPYDECYKNARESVARLAEKAKSLGLTVAVENVWNRFLYSPLEFARFVDECGEGAAAYFDVGNIMAHGFPGQWIRILGNRLRAVHVKDYRTDRPGATGFCNLLEGDVPWGKVMKRLRETGYDWYLTAEVGGYRTYPDMGLEEIARAIGAIIARTEGEG